MRELPEVIRIPFEEAVKDIQLQGWEDEWFASGEFDPQTHGVLAEPKIDFVYNCKSCGSYLDRQHYWVYGRDRPC